MIMISMMELGKELFSLRDLITQQVDVDDSEWPLCCHKALAWTKQKKRVGNSFHLNTSHLMAQSFWVHCNLNLTPPPKQIANLVAMEFFAQGDKEDEKSSKSNPL